METDLSKKRKKTSKSKLTKKKKLSVKVLNESGEHRPKASKNRTRVLVFMSRRIPHNLRILLNDIKSVMPHCKPAQKSNYKSGHFIINEICEVKNCNKCIYLEYKTTSATYMWVANVPTGPTVQFLVENAYSINELKLSGKSAKGSRSLLSFDKNFETSPHWMVIKELFSQVFGVPKHHPKSEHFVDHVMSFSIVDDRIWVRNYQIIEENEEISEIGPRFTLNPLKILKGSFSGEALLDNTQFLDVAMLKALSNGDNEIEKD